jgi:hypothetical protein
MHICLGTDIDQRLIREKKVLFVTRLKGTVHIVILADRFGSILYGELAVFHIRLRG